MKSYIGSFLCAMGLLGAVNAQAFLNDQQVFVSEESESQEVSPTLRAVQEYSAKIAFGSFLATGICSVLTLCVMATTVAVFDGGFGIAMCFLVAGAGVYVAAIPLCIGIVALGVMCIAKIIEYFSQKASTSPSQRSRARRQKAIS